MPVEQPAQNTETPATASEASEGQQNSLHMESVNRIAKLPVVESTINAASNMYEKVKPNKGVSVTWTLQIDSNQYINWTLSTAESTVHTAVEKISPLATPVAARLEGPIKKVDGILCTGLDYVEHKVPCVKLPPDEMLANTKNYINETVTPAMQTAKDAMQPAVQTATQLKDTCVNKVGEYLGKRDNCGTCKCEPGKCESCTIKPKEDKKSE